MNALHLMRCTDTAKRPNERIEEMAQKIRNLTVERGSRNFE